MTDSVHQGILLAVVGGILQGSFALPMKRMERRWSWENTWLVYSAIGLIFFPAVLAWLTIPSLIQVVGWPIFMSMNIIVANVLGVLSGEWAGTSGKARGLSWGGILILVVAIVVVAMASQG